MTEIPNSKHAFDQGTFIRFETLPEDERQILAQVFGN